MKRNSHAIQAKLTKKAGRNLTKGLALGTKVVPSKRKDAPQRMTTSQWLQGAL